MNNSKKNSLRFGQFITRFSQQSKQAAKIEKDIRLGNSNYRVPH